LEAARSLLARCALAQGTLLARLLEVPGNGPAGAQAGDDGQLLDVKEAAGGYTFPRIGCVRALGPRTT